MVGKAKAVNGTEPEMARAIEWMLLLRSGLADGEAVAGHRAWRSEHPSHEAAWERVSKALGAFDTLRQRGVPGTVVRQTVGTVSRRGALRATLGLAGMGVVGGGAGMLGWQMAGQQGLLADQHTGLAQRRQESLPDGGSLWLDARTAVDVAFESGQRELTLHHGRMLVRSSAAGAGLLQVRTAAGSLTAGDSRFVVQARRDRPLQVTAVSGSVTLTAATGERVEVQEGRRLVAAAGRAVQMASARGTESLWTRGLISLDNEPLGELVESLQDYRSGVLRVSDRAAQLRVSGVFSLDDTERTLRALAETQPLRITASTRYWVSIDLA